MDPFPAQLVARSTREVFEDHLRLAAERDLEQDLARDVGEDVVMSTGRGVFRGHDGVRERDQLMSEVPRYEGRMASS